MVDSAIERLAIERLAREREREQPIELARRTTSDASLVARRESSQLAVPRVPTRLRWKGLDVSEEFREYAERVARGEDLPPFEGRVLAEPNAEFPWGASAPAPRPEKRTSHPMLWGASIVLLALLGWSLVLKVQGTVADEHALPEFSALETTVAPLTPEAAPSAPESEASAAQGDVTPHDMVLPSPRTILASEDPPPAAESPAADVARASTPAAIAPAPIVATPEVAPTPVAPAPNPAPVAPRAAPAAPKDPSPLEDEFGIMTSVNPAPVAAASADAPPSPSPAPAGAKSNGNVGDMSRAGQPPAPGVRKEPGSESSAKGSLLVETPSF